MTPYMIFGMLACGAAACGAAACGAAACGAAYAEPYRIMTNSPVHTTGTGNEVALVYGQAPGADWVDIIIHDTQWEVPVRDGSFHLTIPAPPPGIYDVSGVWGSRVLQPAPEGWVETVTTGHLVDGVLTILGRGFGDIPAGTITIQQGAHTDCIDCVDWPASVVEAGQYVLVSNIDAENHQFHTDAAWAVQSTGNLDPGESVRLPFNAEGTATYQCIYHPWLTFTIQTDGSYAPVQSDGALILDVPDYTADTTRVIIRHTGSATSAHVAFIQSGLVLAAGTTPLTGGHGVYTVDSSDWLAGEVIISVSAGNDHAAGAVSVRPPPGAAERSGAITGYDGPDGILVQGGLVRPSGVIPLDAAAQATAQLCTLGGQATFVGDMGLERGEHYTEGTVLCDGSNLGVYLLESGLALTDPRQCGLTRAQWLIPYCTGAVGTIRQPVTSDMPDVPVPIQVIPVTPDTTNTSDDEFLIPDTPAIPDSSGMVEPNHTTCDHVIDPECPCPDGWVRNGMWCDPQIDDTMMDAAEEISDIREGAVESLEDVFVWVGNAFAELGRFFLDLLMITIS